MPRTPSIKLRTLIKTGLLSKKKFFARIAEENNYVDAQMAKDFYLGMVRVITRDLRKNGVCQLPHMGYFALVKQKDRKGWSGPERKLLIGKYSLKFYANDNWRKYFARFLKGKQGKEALLDPREKILGQQLD